MLQIQNVTLIHRRDNRTLIEGLSFVLRPGDRIAVIGEEGNGKSTLLKWLYDPALTQAYIAATGERIVRDETLGYLPQELPPAQRAASVYEFFCAEEAFYAQTPRNLGRLASSLGLAADFFYREQQMGTLSGGEKIKAQLARLLMGNPTVLLLDEPSNDLDLDTLSWLETFLVGLKASVLFVSHDETLLERVATGVVHLEQLRHKTRCRATVARVPYAVYAQQRAENMENERRLALNGRREEAARQEKLMRIRQKVERDQQTISRRDPHGGYLLKKKMKAVTSQERRFAREAQERVQMPEAEEHIGFAMEGQRIAAGKAAIDFHLDCLQAPDGRPLAQNISLFLRGGEKVCIIGRNGCGKTTLLRAVKKALFAREDLAAAYMPQDYTELLDSEKTPVAFLLENLRPEDAVNIRTRLGSLKYTAEEMEHPVRELSGGQKAKLLLLKLSLSGANVLLLDEPTRNFSPLSGPVIRRTLAAFPGAILAVSHDRKLLLEVFDRLYRLTPDGLLQVTPCDFNA